LLMGVLTQNSNTVEIVKFLEKIQKLHVQIKVVKTLVNKLQLNIEVATDLKKVLEEHILIGKVEFTLDEVLEIAKREFHEIIIEIIKRKR
jgi:hypothetical protein